MRELAFDLGAFGDNASKTCRPVASNSWFRLALKKIAVMSTDYHCKARVATKIMCTCPYALLFAVNWQEGF